MTDIVERLRAITGQAGDHGDVQLCMAAADEIERLRLTDAEREAVKYALSRLEWPLDGPQLAVAARAVGPSCEVPEHQMKATLRGLLERTK